MRLSKTPFAVAAIAALLALTPSMNAQSTNASSTNSVPGGGRQGGARSAERQMTALTEQLKLTEDQKPKVAAVLEEQRKKMTELRGDSALAPEDRRAKLQTFREEAAKKMKEFLTADQFKKYEEVQQQRNRRQGGEGAGGPAAGGPGAEGENPGKPADKPATP